MIEIYICMYIMMLTIANNNCYYDEMIVIIISYWCIKTISLEMKAYQVGGNIYIHVMFCLRIYYINIEFKSFIILFSITKYIYTYFTPIYYYYYYFILSTCYWNNIIKTTKLFQVLHELYVRTYFIIVDIYLVYSRLVHIEN